MLFCWLSSIPLWLWYLIVLIFVFIFSYVTLNVRYYNLCMFLISTCNFYYLKRCVLINSSFNLPKFLGLSFIRFFIIDKRNKLW